jgi:hypothetical protein
MRKIIITVAALGMLALAAPAMASASYTIGKGQAERDTRDAAEIRYSPWGVDAGGAYCRPQGYGMSRSEERQWRRYTWHRWVCTWVGSDEGGRSVYGSFRIDGHSDGTFGYMPMYGGLRWK